MPEDAVQLRIRDAHVRPTLVYLPGLHGDWTVATPLGQCLADRLRFVTVTYPRTVTWTLPDYGRAVRDALTAHQIRTAWILAESFGSQVAWSLFGNSAASGFHPGGLILAGGFVRHPWPGAARACARLLELTPLALFGALPRAYIACARSRLPRSPETRRALEEFLRRRTAPDLRAMAHRLRLLAENDPTGVARGVVTPVYQVSGRWDPIVPTPLVRRWLRRHCPGFRESCTLRSADHNVLLMAAPAVARQILTWMSAA
jgi:pimeloyl-ACP methyl ester carboxylesterase